ncbi:MAG: AI-2E family transporter [Candidatus Nanopelagicales bacterium]
MAAPEKTQPQSLEPGALSGPLGAWFRRPLSPWSAHAFTVAIVLVLVAWLATHMLGKVWYLLWWFIIAAFLYFAMAPAVDWLVRKGLKRGIATALVMLALLISIGVLLVAMTPLIVGEIETAIRDAPVLLSNLKDFADRFGINIDTASNSQQVQQALSALQGHLPDLAGGAVSVTSALVGGFFEFFVVLLFTFFLLANQDRFRRFVLSFLTPSTQTVVGQAWDIAVYKTGGYLYSRILTSILAGTVVGVALWFLDCPYALALAIWYGLVSQFLPMIGTYVAAALPLIILVTRNPMDALVFVLVLAAWIPFQDYVISPRVSAKTMALTPASALIALLAGGAMFGALGAFLALPAAAVIQSIMTAFFPRHAVVESAATRG